MSSSKERQAAVRKLRAFNFSAKTDISDYRRRIDGEFSEAFVPNRVDVEEKKYGGVVCDVLRPEMYSKKRLMIYVHGGSFVAGSRESYRSFVASLANACSCVAVVPEFRLAPAHPFPFPINDVQDAFLAIYNECDSSIDSLDEFSTDIPEIVLMADSSGASIAIGFLLGLKAQFRKAISRVVLFSPWLDLSEDNPRLSQRRGGDEVFSSESVRLCAESYATVENRNRILVSPVLGTKEDFRDFPPFYIQIGEKEMFAENAVEFDRLLTVAGVNSKLDVWKGMPPLFQMADEFLAESHLAVERIGNVIVNRIFEEHEEV